MAYLIDRQRALRTSDVVAIVPVRQRRLRSRVILRDNSLYHTLTRPKTFLRCAGDAPVAGIRLGGASVVAGSQGGRNKGARWRNP